MAPLKLIPGEAGKHQSAGFPWLKSHGSIEAYAWGDNFFIDWCFHDWKVMAPLKLFPKPIFRSRMLEFPWLKSHGSIEAFYVIVEAIEGKLSFHDWKVMAPLKQSMGCRRRDIQYGFHDWKVMAPLKLRRINTLNKRAKQFPWLKSKLPIEAMMILNFLTHSLAVSMTEKSWLHWSVNYGGGAGVLCCCFHDWKVMAPLKQNNVGEDHIVR